MHLSGYPEVLGQSSRSERDPSTPHLLCQSKCSQMEIPICLCGKGSCSPRPQNQPGNQRDQRMEMGRQHQGDCPKPALSYWEISRWIARLCFPEPRGSSACQCEDKTLRIHRLLRGCRASCLGVTKVTAAQGWAERGTASGPGLREPVLPCIFRGRGGSCWQVSSVSPLKRNRPAL